MGSALGKDGNYPEFCKSKSAPAWEGWQWSEGTEDYLKAVQDCDSLSVLIEAFLSSQGGPPQRKKAHEKLLTLFNNIPPLFQFCVARAVQEVSSAVELDSPTESWSARDAGQEPNTARAKADLITQQIRERIQNAVADAGITRDNTREKTWESLERKTADDARANFSAKESRLVSEALRKLKRDTSSSDPRQSARLKFAEQVILEAFLILPSPYFTFRAKGPVVVSKRERPKGTNASGADERIRGQSRAMVIKWILAHDNPSEGIAQGWVRNFIFEQGALNTLEARETFPFLLPRHKLQGLEYISEQDFILVLRRFVLEGIAPEWVDSALTVDQAAQMREMRQQTNGWYNILYIIILSRAHSFCLIFIHVVASSPACSRQWKFRRKWAGAWPGGRQRWRFKR
jgi:hypothetical protein